VPVIGAILRDPTISMSESAQREACRAIATLATNSPDIQRMLNTEGIAAIVVELLCAPETHAKDKDVLAETVLWAVGALCTNCPDNQQLFGTSACAASFLSFLKQVCLGVL